MTKKPRPPRTREEPDFEFMYYVWKKAIYDPTDIAFRIRAVVLARLESKLYHIDTTQGD